MSPFSRTMRAWYSTLAAVGTTSRRCDRYSLPPEASSSPRSASSSARVRTSTTTPRSLRATIARKIRRWPSRKNSVSSANSDARRIASRSMIIAPSTACSASSDHGGRRSRNVSATDGAIEEFSSKLDIFPRWPLPGRISQERRGMVRDHQRHAIISVNSAAQFADSFTCIQQRLGGKRPERHDHAWLDQLDLAEEIRTTGLNFIRHRIAIAGRAMLQDVANVDVVPRKFNGSENLVEELARLADKRSPEFVFGGTGRFSDAHEVGVGIPFTGNRILRFEVKWTKRACRDSGVEFSQRGELCGTAE